MGPLLLLLCIALASLVYLCLIRIHNRRKDHFESKGVFYLGDGMLNMIRNITTGVSFSEDVKTKYTQLKAKNIKVGGTIDFGKVALFVTDPEIFKAVMVKDFEYFEDRRPFLTEGNEIIFDKMLLFQTGQKWKKLRTKLSPTLTTGKMKRLFNLFETSGEKLVKFVEAEMRDNDEMDLSPAFTKYTIDAMASTTCGMDSKAFDTREHSFFEKMGDKLTFNFAGFQLFKFAVAMLVPKMGHLLGFKVLEAKENDFFMGAIKSQIHHRQKNNLKGNDFIQLMMEAREGTLKTDESEIMDPFEKDAVVKDDRNSEKISELLDDDGIVANAVLFILAGYETTQALLLFATYIIAVHQDVQERLRVEVENALEESGGRFNYDAVAKLTYLDMVINETLRYYPPGGVVDRLCNTPYKIPGTDFVIQPGETIQIPTMGLHHDPEYWQDPDKFDPERFSPENKANIVQYAYQPFGHGPRNCIGKRFALAEVKVALANLVYHFNLRPSKRTLIPMKFAPTYIQNTPLKPDGGMFLSLEKISR